MKPLLPVIGLFLVASCTSLSPLEEVTEPGCQYDTQCRGERICHLGMCVFPEQVENGGIRLPDGGFIRPDGGTAPDGGDPGDGGTPDAGPRIGPEDGALGSACGSSADCEVPGSFCVFDLPGGYCAMAGCDECAGVGACITTQDGDACVQACEGDVNCREGYFCTDAFGDRGCVPGEPRGERRLGDPCREHVDCADPTSFCIGEFPGGYCVITDCSRCPSDGVCVENNDGRFCVKACATDNECRDAYACSTLLGPASCLPRFGGGEVPVGGACTSSADCAGSPAVCIETWPGGYCAVTDCAACPDGSTCVTGQTNSGCFKTCSRRADCRNGYRCAALSQGRVCVPE